MSNYVKTVDFAAKDALASGNPSKIASGTQIGTEFDNIATAVATKEDTANKGQASGYASLDSSSEVPSAQISEDSVTQHEAALSISGSQIDDAEVTNAKLANMAQATVKGRASAAGTGAPVDLTAAELVTIINTADGTGTGLDADLLDGEHASAFADATHNHTAAEITSGTLANARISAASVTQHQASLSIASSQITGTIDADTLDSVDSASFARSDATDTISGAWTYSSRPKMSGAGGFLSHASSTNTGGSVTVSTSAASGTPAAGDIWIQYTA